MLISWKLIVIFIKSKFYGKIAWGGEKHTHDYGCINTYPYHSMYCMNLIFNLCFNTCIYRPSLKKKVCRVTDPYGFHVHNSS